LTKTLYTIDSLDMKKVHGSDIFLFAFLALLGGVWFVFRGFYGSFYIPPAGEILSFLLLAPVAEELFFRGILQDGLIEKVKGSVVSFTYANILTSVIFAAVHIPFWGFAHSALVFFPSLAFGLLYDRTGNLIFPMFLHAIYNLNIFIV